MLKSLKADLGLSLLRILIDFIRCAAETLHGDFFVCFVGGASFELEFWCCEQGNFDWISRLVLRRLKQKYQNICLCMVCAYNPDKYSRIRQNFLLENYEVIYPEEAAKGALRFAIARRNKFIAENADIVVCYITHHSGGAYQAVKIAEKCGKRIINLAELL